MSLGDGLAVDRGGHGIGLDGSRCRGGSAAGATGAAGGVDVCAKSGGGAQDHDRDCQPPTRKCSHDFFSSLR